MHCVVDVINLVPRPHSVLQSFLRSCARSLIWVPNKLSNYRKCILNFSFNLIGKSGIGMRLFSSRIRNPSPTVMESRIQRVIRSRIHNFPGFAYAERAIETTTKLTLEDLVPSREVRRGPLFSLSCLLIKVVMVVARKRIRGVIGREDLSTLATGYSKG